MKQLSSKNADTLFLLVKEHQRDILRRWQTCLQDHPDYRDTKYFPGFDELTENIDFLYRMARSGYRWERTDVLRFIRLVRSEALTLVDFHRALSSLENVIEEVMTESGHSPDKIGIRFLRRTLETLYRDVIKESIMFYELALESSIVGFCQIDIAGTIVFANSAFKRMAGQTENIEGQSFANFFKGSPKEELLEILSGKIRQEKFLRQIQWHDLNGRSMPIGLELSSVCLGKECLGYYARITDVGFRIILTKNSSLF